MFSSRTTSFLPLLIWGCCSGLLLQGASSETTPQAPPPRQNVTVPDRVFPGMASFPSHQSAFHLGASLKGGTVFVTDAVYPNATEVYNRRKDSVPYLIHYVETVQDVQKIVRFAKEHNLLLIVRSSGHSFIGRSSHDGSIVISLEKMNGKQFRLNSTRSPAGEVTVESGNRWLEVYEAVDQQVTYDDQGNKQRRVIVGGSAHTVSMGGYTLGGGHAPICRKLGLAVDNLLEATIVLADGRKAVVNAEGTRVTDLDGNTTHSTDTSLFWAIRGGGGSAWGVVIDFTFKLHFAPQRFRRVWINWALYYLGYPIGNDTIKFVMGQLAKLSEDWGGYMIVSGVPLDKTSTGALSLALNHFGSDDSPSNSEIDAILKYNPDDAQFETEDTRFDTFVEYERTASDAASTYAYIYNNFIHDDLIQDPERLNKLTDFLMDLKNTPGPLTSIQICTGTLIGGQMARVASGETPVNPLFRTGLLSMTCALAWSDVLHRDDFYIDHALRMKERLAQLGEGTYFNEPAEDQNDWKVQFWGSGSTYDRLLRIKQKWDPDQFFWCHNCVGSDLSSGPPECPEITTTPVPSSGQATWSCVPTFGVQTLLMLVTIVCGLLG